MDYWLVAIINIIIGIMVAAYNVLLSFPVMLMGLTFGLFLIILNKLWR